MTSEKKLKWLEKLKKLPRTKEWRENISKGRIKGKYYKCEICEKEIWRTPSQVRNRKHEYIFCSVSCKAKYHSNRMTEEHKIKIGISSKKLWKTRERIQKQGELNPNWRGGNKNWWRWTVVRRDNYKCFDCGMVDSTLGFMDAHHIKPKANHPEFKWDLNNGITLCPNCHRRRTIENRKLYGKKAQIHTN